MAIYRFRVTFEDYDDVWRDVEIRSIQSFEDLHHAIHSAIGFDASKTASFYMSDDHWTKGREITNRELKESEKETVTTFRRSRLCDFIADPHQKIYYIFDPAAQWAFRVELVKILAQEEIGVFYPRCTKVTGEAPKQYTQTTPAVIPMPEDFDPDAFDDMIAEDDEYGVEEEEESGEVMVAEAEDVKDMGELDTNQEAAEDDDEFQTADDEMSEEESSESDDF